MVVGTGAEEREPDLKYSSEYPGFLHFTWRIRGHIWARDEFIRLYSVEFGMLHIGQKRRVGTQSQHCISYHARCPKLPASSLNGR